FANHHSHFAGCDSHLSSCFLFDNISYLLSPRQHINSCNPSNRFRLPQLRLQHPLDFNLLTMSNLRLPHSGSASVSTRTLATADLPDFKYSSTQHSDKATSAIPALDEKAAIESSTSHPPSPTPPGDEPDYPTGLKLGLIVLALCL